MLNILDNQVDKFHKDKLEDSRVAVDFLIV